MADAVDSKSTDSNIVGVQVPSRALLAEGSISSDLSMVLLSACDVYRLSIYLESLFFC